MAKSPLVSIGLPVYNGEPYLETGLKCILSQSFDDFELIIADNESTDRTRDICLAFAANDPRVRYIRNERNLGAADNYNLVFRESRGRYFKWAAHDDLFAPDFVGRCAAVLDDDNSVVVAYARTLIIDEDGKGRGEYEEDLDLDHPSPVRRFESWLFDAPGECNAVFGLIRSSVLARTPLIGKYKASDMILLAELALAGRLQRIPELLFFRRDHPETSVRAFRSNDARAEWFDPALRGTITLPRFRWVREYWQAIGRSRISVMEKARCRALVGKWAFKTRRRLARELVTAARQRLRTRHHAPS